MTPIKLHDSSATFQMQRRLPAEISLIEDHLPQHPFSDELAKAIYKWINELKHAGLIAGVDREEVFNQFLPLLKDILNEFQEEKNRSLYEFMISWVQKFDPEFHKKSPPANVNERMQRFLKKSKPLPKVPETDAWEMQMKSLVSKSIEKFDRQEEQIFKTANDRLDQIESKENTELNRIQKEIVAFDKNIQVLEEENRVLDQKIDKTKGTLEETVRANLQLKKAINQLAIDIEKMKRERRKQRMKAIVEVTIKVAQIYFTGTSNPA